VMDNLSSHKVDGVRQRIEAVGAKLLYLPPYSPDLNPIEKAWSKFKQLLRSPRLGLKKPSTSNHRSTSEISAENAQAWFRLTLNWYSYDENCSREDNQNRYSHLCNAHRAQEGPRFPWASDC